MVHFEAVKGIKKTIEFRNMKLKDMNPQKGVSNPDFILFNFKVYFIIKTVIKVWVATR
jgi:hypothetical protein